MQFVLTHLVFVAAIQLWIIARATGNDCLLTRANLESLNHAFFADNNLMRQATVASGSRLTLACSNNVISVHDCQRGTLNPALPANNCNNRLRAEVVNGQAPDCLAPATLYRVGFNFGGQFHELYRSCYNRGKVQPKYVEHTVYRKPFATDRPETSFTTDLIVSGADAATFEANSVYDRFVALLGFSQGYVEGHKDVVVNRGHLAPSADFLFVENKRATFKVINIFPQFGRINNGNWKAIEDWIRRLNSNTVNVRTGTIGVLELPHADNPSQMVPMYLGDNQKNPIPMWMYKVVQGVAFLTYNNPFATDLPSFMPCPAVNCPAIGLQADFRLGYTYCCDVNSLNRVING